MKDSGATMEEYPKVYLYRQIVQSKLFIDNHYSNAIDLIQIADSAFFSKFHFIRLFKKVYGKTPHQYLTAVRMEHAKLQLESGGSVSEVCTSVGLDSLSSFSGLFKKTTGLAPSAYRQQRLHFRMQLREQPLHHIPGCFAEKNRWVEKSNFEEVRNQVVPDF
jgi:AraC-like DNA-binding protein